MNGRSLCAAAPLVLMLALTPPAAGAAASSPLGSEGSDDPLILPIAGDWDGDGVTDLGWYQAELGAFFFLEMSSTRHEDGTELVDYGCSRPPLPQVASGLRPIAGNWDGSDDGSSEVGLFDPSRREYYLFRRADGGAWELAQRYRHPVAGQGGWPVAGNWDSDPEDETGLFLESEHRFLLLADHGPGAAVIEVVLTDLDEGPWRPVAGDWGDGFGHHVVGVWHPDRRELRLSFDNESGPTYQAEDYSKEGPDLLPFSGRWWAYWTSVGFYDPGEDGRAQFVLYPCDFGPPCYPHLGGRRPILLPPPEDPVVTSCAGAR